MTRGFRELLDEPLWQELLTLGVEHRYRPKSVLVRQGDPGGHLLALTRGRVSVLGNEEDGSGAMVALRGPGDLIGEMATRSGSTRTATVVALDECRASKLPAEAVHRLLDARDARGAMNDYLVAKLSETVPYQVRMVHFNAGQRCARLLLEVVALAGPEHRDPMRVPFSQEALAAALGLSRSTVTNQIAAWRKDGTLAAGPRLVVASLPLLARHAGVTSVTS
ncbi:Crp/Fnr family transcriptional regulator [Umezawaea endophytica]|uniref:Crp/Fnr family transcriptional regulator n=1 Tax=Umezawaea endophytica TaxID=1654476 RepID=A0A9X2VGB0_9PSEU|nr:Crp/Fnr family transcriptional regulator [Umezawaea endophytica]MCS7476110.1 Crp/Fnr family transcriptional regulator [Umezawaea endophytica]